MVEIPAANLYFMFAYAWDKLREAREAVVGREDAPSIQDLLATVLVHCVDRVLRRGLDRQYKRRSESLRGIRGKLLVGDTIRAGSHLRGVTICETSHLTYDVLHNRILRTALRHLIESEMVTDTTRHEVAGLWRRMHEIEDVQVPARQRSQVQLHSNNRHYGLLLQICELVLSGHLPSTSGGLSLFRDINREIKLSEVFEAFVRNFYKREQASYRVRSRWIRWTDATMDSKAQAHLPVMITDASLESDNRNIIIDTKWYREALAGRFIQKTIRSGHLYQIYAYLQNARLSGLRNVSGILLYPQTNEPIDLSFEIQGFDIRIKTIDLSQPWRSIHKDLLRLVDTETAA